MEPATRCAVRDRRLDAACRGRRSTRSSVCRSLLDGQRLIARVAPKRRAHRALLPARPRNTSTARLMRRRSSSDNRPTRLSSFVLDTVVILSIIRWLTGGRSAGRFDGQAHQRRVDRVGGEWADCHGRRPVEGVVLEDDRRPRLARIVRPAGDGPHTSPRFIRAATPRRRRRTPAPRVRTRRGPRAGTADAPPARRCAIGRLAPRFGSASAAAA